MSLQLGELLQNAGYLVKQYRTSNEGPLPNKNEDLLLRAQKANDWGADYFISIHTNSAETPFAKGVETYAYKPDTTAAKLAEFVQESLVNELGSQDRGVRFADFVVLRRTRMPAILVELGFASNPDEALNLNSPAWRSKAANATFHGIQNFLRLG